TLVAFVHLTSRIRAAQTSSDVLACRLAESKPRREHIATQRRGYRRRMLVGFLLALGCSVCYGAASVMQAVAARSVEAGGRSGVDALLLLRAVRQWRFMAGVGLDGVGFLLQVLALRLVP